ncbi:hypothetical protein KR018_010012 [Drosophila ironensis]|nr:hypothetical protein KR018_010012 [Drosophila ironensis]
MNSLLLGLNDDCLVSVLTCLPIKDHLSFSHTCTRFRNIVVNIGKSIYKHLKMEGTPEEWMLLRLVGKNVETLYTFLDVSSPMPSRRTVRKLINLRAVTFCVSNSFRVRNEDLLVEELMFRLPGALPNLKAIGIIGKEPNTFCKIGLYWDFAAFLNKCAQFKSKNRVFLFRNTEVNEVLPDIVRHFSSVLYTLPDAIKAPPLEWHVGVTQLCIRAEDYHCAPGIMEVALTTAAERFSNLEELCLQAVIGCTEMMQVVRLQNLRKFRCHMKESGCLDALCSLTRLEDLFIYMAPLEPILTTQIISLLRACTRLNKLGISSSADQYEGNPIHAIINVLKEVRDEETQQPLKLQLPFYNARLVREFSTLLTVAQRCPALVAHRFR